MSNKVRTAVKPLVAFSWGYAGWGNHTRQLVNIVDAIERSRGWLPPLFIDVRIRRQVRAVGFRERVFEVRLGPGRYCWLRGLGNRAIIEDLSEDVVIDDPSQANVLLDHIAAEAKGRRRVIFFCSCGSPQHAASCHRAEVAILALRAARQRKIALAIHEWPGGSPVSTSLDLSVAQVRKLIRNRLARLPLPAGVNIERAAALPHLSLIHGATDEANIVVVSGPALPSSKGWLLPVHRIVQPSQLPQIQRTLNQDLIEMNLAPRGAALHLPRRWRHESL